nr:ankyrin repeat protein [Megavirus caiporensis]
MDELISFDRNQRLESVLKHIKKLDHDDFYQIKKAILQQEFRLNFDGCVPDIFETRIKTMKYKSSYDNPEGWECGDGIECKFNMEFDNDCSINLSCEYITYYNGGDLDYTDIDNNRYIKINIGKKSYSIYFNAIENINKTCISISKKALKLLDALSIEKNDQNKKKLGVLIYNIVGQTKPENYYDMIDIMPCNDFDDIAFIYEP